MSNWYAVDTDQNPGMTAAQQQQNVTIITQYLRSIGWTDNAIAAFCGNCEIECYLNPGQFELGQNYNPAYGFGLVQWTPYTKFSEWAGSNWRSNYDLQLQRIKYELDNGLQWTPAAAYNYMSFYDFTQSTATPEYLAMAFEYSYERGTPFQSQREAAARKWYEYITGIAPGPTLNIPIWLLFKIKWENGGK